MKAALWVRVSDPDNQTIENQIIPLKTEAERRGLEVVQVFKVGESAFQGAHLTALEEVYRAARANRFEVLIIWSLDRLTRQGIAATLEVVNRLAKAGIKIVSLQEAWVEVEGPTLDLLLAITGWVAKYESERRSERTKAGMKRAQAQGKHLGRPKGSLDKRRRKTKASASS